MPKGFKRKNAGVGVDFRRVKHKVGKKVGKAQNETDTNVVSKSITLPEQSIGVDKGGAAVTHRNLSLKDLLSQCTHHNDRVRCDALKGLIELLKANPKEAQVSALQLLTTVSSRLADRDESCRAAVKQLLQEALLPAMGSTALSPFFPVLLAHVNAALTHLAFPVRTDAMACLEVLMDYRPASINPEEFTVVLEHFVSSLSRKSRGGGVSLKTGSLQSLLTIVTKLLGFLKKAFPKIKTSKPFENQSSKNHLLPLGARRCGLPPSAGLSNECKGSSVAAAINLFRVLSEECWAECIPDSLSIAPDEDAALCAAAVVQSCLVLVDRFGKMQNFLSDCESCFDHVVKYFPIQSPDSNTLKSQRAEQSLVDINVSMAHLLVRFMSPCNAHARAVGSTGACNGQAWKDRLERLAGWLDGMFVHGCGLKKTKESYNNATNSLREASAESIALPALSIASELLRVVRSGAIDYVDNSHISRILHSILEFWKQTVNCTSKRELHKTKIITAIIETFLVFEYGPELEYCIEVILNDLLKVLWMSLQGGSNALTRDLANKSFTLLLNVASRRHTSQGLLRVSETIGALFCYPGSATRKQQRKKNDPERRSRYHPGPVAGLPIADRTLAVDVLYHLPGLSDGIIDTVKVIALEMTEDEYSQGLAVRLVDMVIQKFAAAAAKDCFNQSKQQQQGCIDFIVDLCIGGDDRCCDKNLDSWKRHTAIVQAGLRGVDGLERLVANRLLEALDKTSDGHSQSQDMRRMYLTYSLLQLCKETGILYIDDAAAEQQCVAEWSSRVTTFMLDCVSTSCFVPPLDGDVHSTARFVLSCLACDYSKAFQIMEVALGVDCLGRTSNWSTIEPALALVQAWVAAMSNYRKKDAAVVLNHLLSSLASAVLALPTVVRDEAKVVSLQNEYKKTNAIVSGALGGLYEAPPLGIRG